MSNNVRVTAITDIFNALSKGFTLVNREKIPHISVSLSNNKINVEPNIEGFSLDNLIDYSPWEVLSLARYNHEAIDEPKSKVPESTNDDLSQYIDSELFKSEISPTVFSYSPNGLYVGMFFRHDNEINTKNITTIALFKRQPDKTTVLVARSSILSMDNPSGIYNNLAIEVTNDGKYMLVGYYDNENIFNQTVLEIDGSSLNSKFRNKTKDEQTFFSISKDNSILINHKNKDNHITITDLETSRSIDIIRHPIYTPDKKLPYPSMISISNAGDRIVQYDVKDNDAILTVIDMLVDSEDTYMYRYKKFDNYGDRSCYFSNCGRYAAITKQNDQHFELINIEIDDFDIMEINRTQIMGRLLYLQHSENCDELIIVIDFNKILITAWDINKLKLIGTSTHPKNQITNISYAEDNNSKELFVSYFNEPITGYLLK